MRVAAPPFWQKPPGLLADLLQPAGTLWDAAGRLRRAVSHTYHAPVPVVCVGNLVAGGAGKTPVALALCRWFVERGVSVHVVTRGHGGRLQGPVRVDPARHDASAVGDEALLHAACAPCWVARDRAAGARAALAARAEAILLDDGLQNPTIGKTLALIVVDAAYGFGNGRVIPAGPLRENLRGGLARADALVLVTTPGEIIAAEPIGGTSVLRATFAPIAGERLAGSLLLAFAGIGRPEKFFATLRALGAELAGTWAFRDHHLFRRAALEALRREAERTGARLITTAKDIVRIPPPLRAEIEVLEVEICWSDPDALGRLLGPVVQSACSDGRGLAERLG